MGISHPTKNVYSISSTGTSGISNNVFILPQDVTSIVVRCYAQTFTGTSPTADVYVQTSEDDGTTFRDCAHFTQITASGTAANAEFAPVPVMGSLAGNTVNAWVGSVQASTLGASRLSGLPILGRTNRITIKYGGTIGSNTGIKVDVFATGQDSAI